MVLLSSDQVPFVDNDFTAVAVRGAGVLNPDILQEDGGIGLSGVGGKAPVRFTNVDLAAPAPGSGHLHDDSPADQHLHDVARLPGSLLSRFGAGIELAGGIGVRGLVRGADGEAQEGREVLREIGFIFQNSQLLPRLTARRNVELPLIYAGIRPKERRERAEAMLERVGLKDRMDHLPSQLSGGQQQRVAIARAMVGNPSILLADEPTGALDQKTGAQIMQLFHELNAEKRTVIMITHDLKIASNARRMVHIIDGEITEGGLQDA